MELGGGCSDQEGATPLLNQLSTTVVCELLDLKQSSVTLEVNNMQGIFFGCHVGCHVICIRVKINMMLMSKIQQKELTLADKNVWMTKTRG